MAFFEDLKKKLEKALEDLSTIEHVLIIESNDSIIYTFQQTEGDSISFITNEPIDEEYIRIFNDAFSASVKARTDITRFLIECITK